MRLHRKGYQMTINSFGFAHRIARVCGAYLRSRYRNLTGKTVIWTVEELHDRISQLSDDKLHDLALCNLDVVTRMLNLLPSTGHEADRQTLEWLVGQLSSFPTARICTLAVVECQRIRKTGVFDGHPVPKAAPKDTLAIHPQSEEALL